MKSRCAPWSRVLGTLAVVLLLAGCGGGQVGTGAGGNTAGGENQPAPAEQPAKRKVKHALEEIEVPAHPQRVVVLDTGELDIALALGVKPVGAVIADAESGFPAYLKDQVEGIQRVGTIAQPDLETIAALQPDLILTNVLRHEKIYDQLKQIAPTVVGVRPNRWKENLKLYAEALGKAEEAERLLQEYEARLAEFRERMGDRLASTRVSLVRSMPDHARIYLHDSFSGSIIRDAGLPRPPAQDKEGIFERVSEERIPDLDGDVMFVFYYGREKGDSLAPLQKNPLWSQLQVVQQGRVYEVDDGHWGLGLGPIAARLVVDDLFRYLAP
ncbi:MAG: iron-siderophore ABC transporter substrate-binding protein [Bacillota bacterium]